MNTKFARLFPRIRALFKNRIKTLIKRPYTIISEYLNEQGEHEEQQMENFEARIFCHELDHLCGVTIENVDPLLGNIEIAEENAEEGLGKVRRAI